jgi:hypothetical protein
MTVGSGGGPAAGIVIVGKGGGIALTASVAAAPLTPPEPGEGGWAAWESDSGSIAGSIFFSASTSPAAAGLAAPEPGEGGSAFDSEAEEEEDNGGAASDVADGNFAKNSEIGFQADLASSHARSVALRLPSATFSRMTDSEKRPAYCPFR